MCLLAQAILNNRHIRNILCIYIHPRDIVSLEAQVSGAHLPSVEVWSTAALKHSQTQKHGFLPWWQHLFRASLFSTVVCNAALKASVSSIQIQLQLKLDKEMLGKILWLITNQTHRCRIQNLIRYLNAEKLLKKKKKEKKKVGGGGGLCVCVCECICVCMRHVVILQLFSAVGRNEKLVTFTKMWKEVEHLREQWLLWLISAPLSHIRKTPLLFYELEGSFLHKGQSAPSCKLYPLWDE